jgi:hypothetical protein
MNTDVEDLLREGMERFTADLRAPVGIVYRAAARRRRRVALRSAAGLTALTGGAAAALVLAPGLAGNTASSPAVDTAYVVKHVSGALNAAEPGDIAQMTITTSGGPGKTTTADEWSYDNQWRAVIYSSPGHPAYDEGSNAASVYTLVNYGTKTWARQAGLGRPTALPAGLAVGRAGCASAIGSFPVLFRFGLPGLGSYASSAPATVATALRAAVSCGALQVAGQQRVDGVSAIELKSRSNSPIAETIWVSPGTYLPVRVVTGPGPGGFGLRQTADITWLPPTAQNLAKLAVPIPAGFHQVTFSQAGLPILKHFPAVSVPGPVAYCATDGPACPKPVAGAPGAFPAPGFEQPTG